MKSFTNANPRDLAHALTLVRQTRESGRTSVLAGGGSDLLGMMKDRLVTPDVVVNLKAIKGLDQVQPDGAGLIIGGLITLEALSSHPLIRRRYPVLAEAAESVATPQIRNVGEGLVVTTAAPVYVTLTGDVPTLRTLTPESIIVIADAAGLAAGLHVLALEITAPAGTTLARVEPGELGIALTLR